MKVQHASRIVLIAAALLAQSFAYAQAPVSEAEDAYHFKFWEGSPYNPAYTEWWYFNLYDAKDDIQAIFTYQVADPLNLTTQGVSNLTAVVYKGSTIIPESDLYSLTAFSASYSAANVSIGPNTVSVEGPDRYTVSGASMDGRLSWNLHYDREAKSWFAGDHMNVASLPWEQMSWLLYMPRAGVTGTLTIDGQTYNMECAGYHDHNWGQWDFAAVVWNWAQYSQPGLTFDLGDFVGNPNGRASLEIAGKRTVFAANQYKLVHTQWAFDAQDNLWYPTQSVFMGENNDLEVRVVMDIQKTAPLATGPPPSLVIYEQPSHFTGEITTQSNWFPLTTHFEGNGFKEYTATSSAP